MRWRRQSSYKITAPRIQALGVVAEGAIRVMLVDEPTGWVAYVCTDPAATVAEVLGCVANRFAPEVAFRD